MLEQLDTLIGFVVVMAIISLLLTIVTQIISTVCGLRGKNLADALEVMIVTLDPNIVRQSKDAAKQLANTVLTHPAISDSVLPMHFTWLLWLRRATAIRTDELVAILESLAGTTLASASENGPAIQEIVSAAAADREAFLALINEKVAAAQTAATAARNALTSAITACRSANNANMADAVAAAGAASVAARNALIWFDGLQNIQTHATAEKGDLKCQHFSNFLKNRLAAANLLAALHDPYTEVSSLASNAEASVSELQKWFNSVQDRAQQWYGTHMRMVTSICALLAAFCLQLDTFQLMHQISSDPEVRSKLLAEADSLQKENMEIVASPMGGDNSIQRESLEKLVQYHPEIAGKLNDLPADSSLQEIEMWIRSVLRGTPNLEQIVSDYDNLFSKAKLGQSSLSLAKLNSEFSETGLSLLPEPYPPLRKWGWPFRHLCGLLVSAALLSLGAPFWFNTLKTITNLRPALANEVDKNPKQDSLQ